MRMARWFLLALVILAGCSAEPAEQTPQSVRTLPTVQSVQSRPDAKLVRIDSISDRRIRDSARTSNPDAEYAVELAPGVYAEKGQTDSLDPDIYGSVFGLCADVGAYQQKYSVGGHCW